MTRRIARISFALAFMSFTRLSVPNMTPHTLDALLGWPVPQAFLAGPRRILPARSLWPEPFRPTLGGGLAVESVSAMLARGPGACPQGPRAGVYRRRGADRVSTACWGRPSSWRASRPCGLMQGPRLGAGRWRQTCHRPSDDLTAKNKQSRYHENHY